MTRGEFVLENCEQFLTARHSILLTDCKSLYGAIHKEGAAPASKDKRLAIELGHSQGQSSVRCNGLDVDGCKISNRRLIDETRLKKD